MDDNHSHIINAGLQLLMRKDNFYDYLCQAFNSPFKRIYSLFWFLIWS